MDTSQFSFTAPWGTSLKVVSLGTTLLTLVVVAFVAPRVPGDVLGGAGRVMVVGLPLLLLVGCALFTVRGYQLEAGSLLIKRLFWSTPIPLESLTRAWSSPHATAGSVRLFGNGGLFSFTGLFSSKRLGRYRAYMMDRRNSVVLEFPERKVVITPGSPSGLLQALQSIQPRADYPSVDDAMQGTAST